MRGTELLVLEPFALLPIFWTGCRSQIVDWHLHTTLYVSQRSSAGRTDRVAVARLICPVANAEEGNAQARAVMDAHMGRRKNLE